MRIVDEVVETPVFTDDHMQNIFRLVCNIKPNVYASSYTNLTASQQKILADEGIQFVHIPSFGGTTTTEIIQTIISRYTK